MPTLIKTATGEIIDFISADLSTSINDYLITSSIELSSYADLLKLTPAKNLRGDYVEVVLSVGFESFALIVESVNTDLTDSFRVSARSSSVFLAEPYSKKITKTWNNTSASGIINELITAVGLSLSFEIVDWTIEKYAVTDRIPIDIIRELLTDANARMMTMPNSGQLRIFYEFQASTTHLNTATPDYSYSGRNIISPSYQFNNNTNFNSVLVATEQQSPSNPSVSVEEKTDGLDRLLLVRTVPVLPISDIVINHASGSNAAITYDGVQVETIEKEQLIFTDNEATLSKPFTSLISVIWQQNDNGQLTIDSYGKVTKSTDSIGLAEINYTSSYHQYRVKKQAVIDKTLIVIDDIPQRAGNGLSSLVVIGAGDNPADAVVARTLSNNIVIRKHGEQLLWGSVHDYNSHNITLTYNGYMPLCGKIAAVHNGLWQFNGLIQSTRLTVSSDNAELQLTINEHLA
jgi:hypothetical protein